MKGLGMYKINWIRLIVTFLFAVNYNAYFGHNWMPQSDAEVICDGIFVLLFSLSVVGYKPAVPLVEDKL